MKTTAWALPLAAVALLASCATTTWPILERFAPAEKQVDVNVGPEWGWIGGKHVIKVQPELLRVRASAGKVIWVLGADAANAGYRFGAAGITFEFPAPDKPWSCRSTPDPRQAFDLGQCGPLAGGRLFECPRAGRHEAGACFKYTVRLQAGTDRDGARPPPVEPKDPWILSE